MRKAVTNTSPLLYLYRIHKIAILSQVLEEVLTVPAVISELAEGQARGYEVPNPKDYNWLRVMPPQKVPSEWLASDLEKGELETMALALEDQKKVVILDDALARRIAQAAGLEVWGTLRVLLEAKKQGLLWSMSLALDDLQESGM